VKNIKYGQEAIGQETDLHLKLLDEAEAETDKTTANIVVADNKLKKLLQTTNTCRLWMIICAEIGAIVGLIILLI